MIMAGPKIPKGIRVVSGGSILRLTESHFLVRYWRTSL
ncbi:hypothetical protein RSOL_065110 [Rhizoctonia solani AG-3 Rhs1AP]|uniref:Uncharacterized protein n=1 Tax=Rhizoctonia solani AG-3 Rhs1AP TaxID=1086054 RepID=X8J0A3_9AGAM|nr:hypothetical protein RSOL_065110 [Rhizoctonia solani AG-3 Rhs1AP]